MNELSILFVTLREKHWREEFNVYFVTLYAQRMVSLIGQMT